MAVVSVEFRGVNGECGLFAALHRCTKRDVPVDFMCRALFGRPALYFNCFLKSIRHSIPMTVSVKSTSTRRCMTCSFFVGFFVFIEREIWRIRRSLCRWEAAFPNTLVILFQISFTEYSFKIWILRAESIMDVWRRGIRYGYRERTSLRGVM